MYLSFILPSDSQISTPSFSLDNCEALIFITYCIFIFSILVGTILCLLVDDKRHCLVAMFITRILVIRDDDNGDMRGKWQGKGVTVRDREGGKAGREGTTTKWVIRARLYSDFGKICFRHIEY